MEYLVIIIFTYQTKRNNDLGKEQSQYLKGMETM
jgi:hypothetical protein